MENEINWFGICIIPHICIVKSCLLSLFYLIKGTQSGTLKNIFPNCSDIKRAFSPFRDSKQRLVSSSWWEHNQQQLIPSSSYKHLVINLLQNQPKLKVLVMSNFDQYHAKFVAETFLITVAIILNWSWTELELSGIFRRFTLWYHYF